MASFKEKMRAVSIRIGLWFLRGYTDIDDDVVWFLGKSDELRLPSGSSIFQTISFNNSISTKLITLLEFGYKITGINKRTDLANGDLVVTITYLSKSDFSNLILWAQKNITEPATSDDVVEKFMGVGHA